MTRIKIIGTKMPGTAPIENLAGQTFDARWDKDRKLYYIQSEKHGGQIGIRKDECKVMKRGKTPV